jgi:hypothetical protein
VNGLAVLNKVKNTRGGRWGPLCYKRVTLGADAGAHCVTNVEH